MPMSNYPNGFMDGVSIRGVPLQMVHPGKVFWVNNSSVIPDGGIGGSDSNPGTYLKPFSTIDYAIGRCTAGRGDIICVMPGHAEDVTTAAGIALDVSGVALVGLGKGELRPILTYKTNTTATFKITGANTSVMNFVHKCNVASLATMFDIQAKDVYIYGNEFREGTQTGLGHISIGNADNDSDRFWIEKCKVYVPTAGNGDHGIEILKDMIQGRILDCEMTGDFDEGCIAVPANGNACLDLQIRGGTYRNTQTTIPAITINGTSCSGVIKDVLLITDTQSTALDNGSLATDNVKWGDETDQVGTGSFFNLPGTEIVVTKTLTSSAVVQAGVDVTGVSSGGVLFLKDWSLRTNGTGLAAGTNFTLETNNTNGAAVFATHAVASLGANVLIDKKTATLGKSTLLENGKKIVAKCTAADCTGAGTIAVDLVFTVGAPGATISAA